MVRHHNRKMTWCRFRRKNACIQLHMHLNHLDTLQLSHILLPFRRLHPLQILGRNQTYGVMMNESETMMEKMKKMMEMKMKKMMVMKMKKMMVMKMKKMMVMKMKKMMVMKMKKMMVMKMKTPDYQTVPSLLPLHL
jgi:hypothetical protein